MAALASLSLSQPQSPSRGSVARPEPELEQGRSELPTLGLSSEQRAVSSEQDTELTWADNRQ